MPVHYVYSYMLPIGKIAIVEEEGYITHIMLEERLYIEARITEETPLIKEAYNQLNEYFKGQRKEFDLPLKPKGTPFQIKCWEALKTIPYGKTWTYKQLANAIGNEKACRAVGGANNKNPIIIVIPCHRVIGTNGQLVGYAGGIHIKEILLSIEKKYSS